MVPRLKADFNGLFGDLLCLAHGPTCEDEHGNAVVLIEGMKVLAFDPDFDGDTPCFLIATGTVIPSPDSLQHQGSVWCLALDDHGCRHVADLDDAEGL